MKLLINKINLIYTNQLAILYQLVKFYQGFDITINISSSNLSERYGSTNDNNINELLMMDYNIGYRLNLP